MKILKLNNEDNNQYMAVFGSRLKKTAAEPRVYAVVLQAKTGSILHLGVHFSLDEAVHAARESFVRVAPAQGNEFVNIDIYDSMSGAEVIKALTESVQVQNKKGKNAIEQIQMIKESKNQLMKMLIEEKNLGYVEKSRNLLTANEKAFIEAKIHDRKTQK